MVVVFLRLLLFQERLAEYFTNIYLLPHATLSLHTLPPPPTPPFLPVPYVPPRQNTTADQRCPSPGFRSVLMVLWGLALGAIEGQTESAPCPPPLLFISSSHSVFDNHFVFPCNIKIRTLKWLSLQWPFFFFWLFCFFEERYIVNKIYLPHSATPSSHTVLPPPLCDPWNQAAKETCFPCASRAKYHSRPEMSLSPGSGWCSWYSGD